MSDKDFGINMLRSFHTASESYSDYPYKGKSALFFQYLDNLDPNFVARYGKQARTANLEQNILADLNKQVARNAKGTLPKSATDLQDFTNAITEYLGSFSYKTKAVFSGAGQGISQIGETAVSIVKKGAMIYTLGLAVAGLFALSRILPLFMKKKT